MADTAHLPPPVFEGSEKRLEVDFYAAPGGPGAPAAGLRTLPRSVLDSLMEQVRFLVLSFVRSGAPSARFFLVWWPVCSSCDLGRARRVAERWQGRGPRFGRVRSRPPAARDAGPGLGQRR
jgi:hypothetical protein